MLFIEAHPIECISSVSRTGDDFPPTPSADTGRHAELAHLHSLPESAPQRFFPSPPQQIALQSLDQQRSDLGVDFMADEGDLVEAFRKPRWPA